MDARRCIPSGGTAYSRSRATAGLPPPPRTRPAGDVPSCHAQSGEGFAGARIPSRRVVRLWSWAPEVQQLPALPAPTSASSIAVPRLVTTRRELPTDSTGRSGARLLGMDGSVERRWRCMTPPSDRIPHPAEAPSIAFPYCPNRPPACPPITAVRSRPRLASARCIVGQLSSRLPVGAARASCTQRWEPRAHLSSTCPAPASRSSRNTYPNRTQIRTGDFFPAGEVMCNHDFQLKQLCHRNRDGSYVT